MPGSTTRDYTSSWAPFLTRRRRNHVQKTVGKPYAGKPDVRIERGMGKQGRQAVPAPLTTSDHHRRAQRPAQQRTGHPIRPGGGRGTPVPALARRGLLPRRRAAGALLYTSDAADEEDSV